MLKPKGRGGIYTWYKLITAIHLFNYYINPHHSLKPTTHLLHQQQLPHLPQVIQTSPTIHTHGILHELGLNLFILDQVYDPTTRWYEAHSLQY